MSYHSSRASDGSRSTDNTGRKPEILDGVGPMINMQRGETRYSFLAGIAANDDGGVLNSDFPRQLRVVPSVLRGEKRGFQKFKREFPLKSNMLDISGHFVGQGTRVVPVGDPLKQKTVSLREGFSSEETRGAYQAWNFIDGELQSEADSSILGRYKSPREAFDYLEK